MSIRTIACSLSNRNSASARASSVLPTPVGPRNRNEPIGRFGSFRPARARQLVGLGLQLLGLLLVALQALDQLALVLPLRLHRGRLLLELGDRALDVRQPLLRGAIVLALEGGALDLVRHDAALDVVDRG